MKLSNLFLVGVLITAFTIACNKSEDIVPKEDSLLVQNEVLVDEYQSVPQGKIITYSNNAIPGKYIVIFNDDAFGGSESNSPGYSARQNFMRAEVANVMARNGLENGRVSKVYGNAIKGFAATLTPQEARNMASNPDIAYIEQDQTVNIAMGGPGGGGSGGGDPQVTPWGITRIGGAASGSGVGTAWIIDSGIDLDHPDLNVDVARSASFLSGGGGNTSADDYNGHGTHVAGTVAAIDNNIGVIGVAAGAPVVAVRVLDRKGSGSNSGVIAGVDYVAANASSGDVANMSLGGGVSTALDNAVKAAANTCPFALAAGNSSTDANSSSPARVNGSNIYTVSSMAQGDNWSSFSNYGNPPVDYCAPGSSVYSTYKSGGYATLSGTSMASPHVCGILLLGNITSDGTVNGDPDGNPDSIAHR